METERIIEQTADGSATLYLPGLDEHYHSVKGAETESRHIFIDMGMKQTAHLPHIRILEVGFGTGLNAFLSLKQAVEANQQVHYTGVELYPLTWETIDALHYTNDQLFKNLHDAPWNVETDVAPGFTLYKVQADFTHYNFPDDNHFDLVYFDAFAPEKQPEMWTQQLFDSVYRSMKPGGILTTYCAKGVIRRMLQQSGFTIERLPGPPGGKREILRAQKV